MQIRASCACEPVIDTRWTRRVRADGRRRHPRVGPKPLPSTDQKVDTCHPVDDQHQRVHQQAHAIHVRVVGTVHKLGLEGKPPPDLDQTVEAIRSMVA